MRTNEIEARDERALLAIFAEALGLVRQDFSEYGFAGLIGATGATMFALALHMIGGPLATAAILPVVLLCALFTLATASAAVRRVLENLEPDSVRSFEAIIVRTPFIVMPFALPLSLAFAAGVAGTQVSAFTNSLLGVGAALALLALAGLQALPRSLYLSALLARGASAKGALAVSETVVRGAPVAVLLAWAFILMPASVLLLLAFATGFDVVSTALAAFAFVFSMPPAAALMTLLYEYAGVDEAQLASTAAARQRPVAASGAPLETRRSPGARTPQAPAQRGDSVAERLNRHVR